jgi:hypothetical protein
LGKGDRAIMAIIDRIPPVALPARNALLVALPIALRTG